MAASNSELGSSLQWLAGSAGLFAGRFLLFSLVVVVFGGPGVATASVLFEPAGAFAWLALFGFVFHVVGFVDDVDAPGVEGVVEVIRPMTRTERYVFVATMVTVAAGMVSTLLFAAGTVGAAFAEVAGRPVLGVLFAGLYPASDAYLGRRFGLSVAIGGQYAAIAFMILVARLQDVSPTVPRQGAAQMSPFGSTPK